MRTLAIASVIAGILIAAHASPAFAQVAAAPVTCQEVNGRLDRLYADLARLRSSIAEARLALDDFQNPSLDYAQREYDDAVRYAAFVFNINPADRLPLGVSYQDWSQVQDAALQRRDFWRMVLVDESGSPREKLQRAAGVYSFLFVSRMSRLTGQVDELQRAYGIADREVAGLRDISATLRCNTPDTQPASSFLPGTISICHKAACIWPTNLRLVKQTGNSGEYVGTDFEGNEAKATLEMRAGGLFRLYISVASKGFSGDYDGETRKGNVVEGRYRPSSGFGPSDVFKATVK